MTTHHTPTYPDRQAATWARANPQEPSLFYPIAIEPGSATTAFGVVVPDLPGCFAAGDTMEQALADATSAISVWLDAAREAGHPPPPPSDMSEISHRSDFAGWDFALVQAAARQPSHAPGTAGSNDPAATKQPLS